MTSSKLQENIIKYLSDGEKHSVQDIKKYLLDSGLTDYSEGQFSGSMNTLVRNGSVRKMERGIYVIKKRSEDMRKCFVVCPIGDEESDIRKNADKLLKHIIKPVCEMCDFEPIRVDQGVDANSITQTIIDHLDNDDLVIADLSGHNPNVFYEMGYRAKSKKPMIHLKKRGESIPFDVNTIRTLEYDLTDIDNVEEIKERLKKTIESFSYTEVTECVEEVNQTEQSLASIVPVLYQILDAVGEVKSEVKGISTDVISAIVTSLKPTQPQVSSDTALQMQLISTMMQNPDNFMKMIELSEKLNSKK